MKGNLWLTGLAAMMTAVFLIASYACAAEKRGARAMEEKPAQDTAKWVHAVEPKPLSKNVKRALQWLLEHQRNNGGWGQGEESAAMGRGMDNIKDKANVGDTCTATLALIRSGSTASSGPYARNILAAIKYVCSEIEESDKDSLFVTQLRGTRLQTKLGTYIDTFLASMLLAEIKGTMPDEKGEKMVADAFHKVIDKIEKNQRDDGTFGGSGWANALSVSIATKGVNRMAQAGGEVSERVRSRLEEYAQSQFNARTGKFGAKGSAGVDLYATAAQLSSMQDSFNTNETRRDELIHIRDNGSTREEKDKAKEELERYDRNAAALKAAKAAVVRKLGDQKFISGFGSNGGEEFLSYMNMGESLVVDGGEEWEKWDKKITTNLNHIQNKDGSWTGHHCITGRTFCTSAALLVLMTDRAPVPVAAKMAGR